MSNSNDTMIGNQAATFTLSATVAPAIARLQASLAAQQAATLTAKEFFFDRLEAYYDFREKSPSIAAATLNDLLRACEVVRGLPVAIPDYYLPIVARLVDCAADNNVWERCGSRLGDAAELLIKHLAPEKEAARRLAEALELREQASAMVRQSEATMRKAEAKVDRLTADADKLFLLAEELEEQIGAYDEIIGSLPERNAA